MKQRFKDIRRDITPHLPTDWATARKVWQAMGLWSEATVVQCLNAMSREGQLERRLVAVHANKDRCEYRARPIP